MQQTQLVLSASFDTKHVSHVHLEEEEEEKEFVTAARLGSVDFEAVGFGVIQQRHFSLVSGFATKHVLQFHLVVLLLSVDGGLLTKKLGNVVVGCTLTAEGSFCFDVSVNDDDDNSMISGDDVVFFLAVDSL